MTNDEYKPSVLRAEEISIVDNGDDTTSLVVRDRGGRVMTSEFVSKVGELTRSDKSLHSLLFNYSPPNIANAKYDNDYAAGLLAQYDHVVLGDGLEFDSHMYHISTVEIIAKMKTLSPGTIIYGYITAGVTTVNNSIDTLKASIDAWAAIGAKGIMIDEAGYDYHVSRSRLNQILAYCHSLGLTTIINAWNSDDALASDVNATYNPSGTPTLADSRDAILLESLVHHPTAYPATSGWATISDIKIRADKARIYRSSLGVKVFAISMATHHEVTDSTLDPIRQVCEAVARIWSLDASGVGATNYASSGDDIGLVRYPRPQFVEDVFRPNAPYFLNNTWTEAIRSDLGIILTYDAETNTRNVSLSDSSALR